MSSNISNLNKNEYSKNDMLKYIQSQMDNFMEEKEKFGMDVHTERKLDAMIACKEMVESIIGEPVNLLKDGRVTIGF